MSSMLYVEYHIDIKYEYESTQFVYDSTLSLFN